MSETQEKQMSESEMNDSLATDYEKENHAAAEESGGKQDKKKLKKLEAELADLQKKTASSEAKLKEADEKYLRMLAEYDNFRRRSQKEKESTYADAYADAVAAILPIVDNLERSVGYRDADAVNKGIEMTLKAAKDSFAKLGITEVECKTFDPNLHNAVMHVEDEQYGEGEIIEVLQKGYQKGDKVIRYAMVKVAN